VEVDEFDLVDLRTSSAFETDTYPAICGQRTPQRPSDANRAAPTPPLAQGFSAGWLSRRNLVVAITTAAVLAAAAVVVYFLVRQ
jgi:hypothetical protein